MISAFINEDHREWDQNLSKIQLAHSTVPNSGSKILPFFLNHGRESVVMHIAKFLDNVDNFTIKNSIDEFN